MVPRSLGRSGLAVTPLGFGAFKIGRNEGIKYAERYAIPDDAAADRLIHEVIDCGINYIDTAPAYGLSEERIGRALRGRREGVVVSTKAGESFVDGRSSYDFSPVALRRSVAASSRRLQMDVLDLVFLHAPAADLATLDSPGAIDTLRSMKEEGLIRAIGFSGKSVAAAGRALEWADVLMVEYHLDDRSHEGVIADAAAAGVGVVVKKGLASGRVAAAAGIPFVLATPGVSSLLIGSLSIDHIRDDVRIAGSTQ